MRRGRTNLPGIVAALVALAGLGVDATGRRTPFVGTHDGKHRGGKLRKGTRPRLREWHLVQEIPPGQVRRRRAAGQRLVRRADGIWVWPDEDRRRYERANP